MKQLFSHMACAFFISILVACAAFAGNSMEGHEMGGKEKFGDLIHESTVDGYMLSYYFMDLRKPKNGDHDKTADHGSHDTGKTDMDKPHHLMVYIMDMNHKPVTKGKVGFLIKNDEGTSQKAMAMAMSDGFGITADMKKKGRYKITAKAVLGQKKVMDSFDYEIK